MQRKQKKQRRRLALKGWKRFLKSVRRKGRIHIFRFPQTLEPITPPFTKKKINRSIQSCPKQFCLEHNLDGVLEYCKQLRQVNTKQYSGIFVDMTEVNQFDVPALVMLLSNINQSVQLGINVQGNYPKDENARTFFEESGFLSHMNVLNNKKVGTFHNHNLIINVGIDNYNSSSVAKVNLEALKLIDGSKTLYQKLNGMLGEMAGNTIKHAYNTNKHYLYGYSYKDDSITFVFADSGFGILSTLKKSLGKQFQDLVQLNGVTQTLLGAFKQRYGSNTGENNRNRGLPFILSLKENNYITELEVISNNVQLLFNEDITERKLNSNYLGTVYVWKVKKQSRNKILD